MTVLSVATSASPLPSGSPPVLLVDDNVGSAKILALLFKQLGCVAHVVHSGESALQSVRETHPPLVVLDLLLGDLSGLEVARRIRASEEFGNPHLIALTGKSADEVKTQTMEAGFDRHLVKPIGIAEVRELIAILDHPRADSPGAEQ